MKKNTLLLMLLVSLTTNSTIYLVEQGNGSYNWREKMEGEVVVKLNAIGKTLPEWFNLTPVSGDQVWVLAGSYTFNTVLLTKSGVSLYGGFDGTEVSASQRKKEPGGHCWDFKNETVFDGNSEVALIGAGGSRSNVIYDGITITNGTLNAVRLRGTEIIQNCIFKNNTASGKGAALMMYQGGSVKKSLFLNNHATGSTGEGGAIAIASLGQTNSIIENCVFENNMADKDGSALFIETANPITIANCLIKGSTGNTFVYIKGNCNFYNNTFVNNGSNTMFISGTPSVKIYNTVIWGASTNLAGGATANVEVKHSAFMNNPRGEWTVLNNITLSADNTGTDVLQHYPSFNLNDFSLQAGSTLIDKGMNIENVSSDFYGIERLSGSYDIGYTEHNLLTANNDVLIENIRVVVYGNDLQIHGLTERASVTLYTLDGKTIVTKKSATNGSLQTELQSGAYIILIEAKDMRLTRKIVL